MIGFDANGIVDCVPRPLFAAQISICGISRTYASPEERSQYEAADDFSFTAFWGRTLSGPLTKVDLPKLGTNFAIPIFIVQGQEDLTAVPELAKAYFDSVRAPRKQFCLTIEGVRCSAVQARVQVAMRSAP